jgi:hypothetical protein
MQSTANWNPHLDSARYSGKRITSRCAALRAHHRYYRAFLRHQVKGSCSYHHVTSQFFDL